MNTNPISRRRALSVGGLGMLGVTMPKLLQASEAVGARRTHAKSVIFLYQFGGPSHLDTFDPKPDAAAGVRSHFDVIDTVAPGIRICDQLPKTAEVMNEVSLVRTVYHTMKNHNSAAYYALTGHAPPVDDIRLRDSLDLFPAYGSVVDKLAPLSGEMPTSISYPYVIHDGAVTPGQHASFLGKAHDPFLVTQDPNAPDFKLPELSLPADVSYERLSARRELQKMIDAQTRLMDYSASARGMDAYYEKALAMLHSEKLRKAFDLASEPAAIRDKFGRSTYGQSLILARRLVEAGTKFVTVYFSGNIGGQSTTDGGWDTHGQNFVQLRKQLPKLDKAMSALLTDLHSRGLDKDVTVVMWGEFGRTPRVNPGAGRDHWSRVAMCFLAGGGMRTGQFIGSSSRDASEAKDRPVHLQEVFATLYHNLGIDVEHTQLMDTAGRPQYLVDMRKPIAELV